MEIFQMVSILLYFYILSQLDIDEGISNKAQGFEPNAANGRFPVNDQQLNQNYVNKNRLAQNNFDVRRGSQQKAFSYQPGVGQKNNNYQVHQGLTNVASNSALSGLYGSNTNINNQGNNQYYNQNVQSPGKSNQLIMQGPLKKPGENQQPSSNYSLYQTNSIQKNKVGNIAYNRYARSIQNSPNTSSANVKSLTQLSIHQRLPSNQQYQIQMNQNQTGFDKKKMSSPHLFSPQSKPSLNASGVASTININQSINFNFPPQSVKNSNLNQFSPRASQQNLMSSKNQNTSHNHFFRPKNSQQYPKGQLQQFQNGSSRLNSPPSKQQPNLNLLEDVNFNEKNFKNFDQAYRQLANKLIEIGTSNQTQKLKSNLLITEKSINNYVQNKHREQTLNENDSQVGIHERLYKEKEQYFMKKNFVNTSKDEQESKLCSFQPNADKKLQQLQLSMSRVDVASVTGQQSFDKFYQDQLQFLEQSKLLKQKLENQNQNQYKDLFKPRLFTRDFCSSHNENRVMSPLERSQVLFQEGTEKLKKLNDSSHILNLTQKYNEHLTLKPKINENSEKIMKQKFPHRSTIDELYQDAQRRVRDRSIDQNELQNKENLNYDGSHQSFRNQSSRISNKQTERLIVEKIEKEIQMGLIQLNLDIKTEQIKQQQLEEQEQSQDHKRDEDKNENIDLQEEIDKHQLYLFLDMMGYLNTTSSAHEEQNGMLINQIWDVLGCTDKMTKRTLKLLLCTIQNIWMPSWMLKQNQQEVINPSPSRILEEKSEKSVSNDDQTPLRDKRSTMDGLTPNPSRTTNVQSDQNQIPILPQNSSHEFYFENEVDFFKLHQFLQILNIQRNQNNYHQHQNFIKMFSNAEKSIDNISGQLSPQQKINNLCGSVNQWFKPQVCKKSEQLDKIAQQKLFQAQHLQSSQLNEQSRERSKDRSLDRPLMMLEKGQLYKHKVEERRKEQSSHETDGCTFAPQTNKRLLKEFKDTPVASRYQSNKVVQVQQNEEQQDSQKVKVFTTLYEQRKHKQPRKDRSPIEIEYEKNSRDCTFSPNFMASDYYQRKIVNNKSPQPNLRQAKDKIVQKQNETLRQNNQLKAQNQTNKTGLNRQVSKVNQVSARNKSQYLTQQSSSQVKQPQNQQARSNISKQVQKPQQVEMLNLLGSDDERTPLLYLEVNLGHNQISKLVVFEGDDPNQVIEDFSRQNQLSDEKKKKLQKVVLEQMAAILPRIDEGDEEMHDDNQKTPVQTKSNFNYNEQTNQLQQ
eukprot:403365686